jgi:hypothetical protein
MSRIVGNCWHCGQGLTEVDLGREAACSNCGKQVHVCRNCRFYRPGRPNDCMEPIAEAVANKERANFCDYFEPHAGAYRGPGAAQQALRQAAENLFK